ncbi:hypothetical protein FRC12_000108 [Ceratobasidium sp. 428]|nr:hypothetical protein FRC12_000108 [Ceratobasidium sp. 428]
MAPRKTCVYAGYFILRKDLVEWSKREAKINLVYKRCLRQEAGFVDLAVDSYLREKRLGDLVKYQYMPIPEHGACGRHCSNWNLVLYRRYGEANSLATCLKPTVWERFKPKPADLAVKQKLEDALGLELSEWTTIAWCPTAMLYDVVPEMLEQGKTELIERIERGPPGPCGENPPPLP